MPRQNPFIDVPENPGPRVGYEVKARPVSTYVPPSTLRIPDMPTENGLTQLAAGLTAINPALQKVATAYRTEQSEKDEAAAYLAVQQAQAKNVEDLKFAQLQGLIPDGASPNFIQALHANGLKLRGERASSNLQAAYFANDEVRNSDDPQKFDQFIQKWRADAEVAHLKDGNPDQPAQYTALEVKKSGYFESIDQAISQIRGQHINYRVQERERLATETAGNLVLQRLDATFDSALDAPDLVKTAKSLNDVFYNPITGSVQFGGMRPSKANEILTEAIVTKAVSSGDASILDVANHIGPNDKSSLANTKTFREKAEVARQHIANSRWMSEERDRKRAEYRGLGVENPEQVEERAREDRARIQEEYASQKQHRDQYAKQLQKHEAVEPEVSAIIKLHSINGDTTSKEIRDHLRTIAGVDPDAYKSITTFLQTQARHGKAVDEHTALMKFTELRASISTDPSKFNSNDIIKAANRGMITAGQVNELFGLVDSAKKTAREFPLMSAPLVNSLRSDLRGAVVSSPLDEFGEGRLRADRATAELNSLIAGYLRSNPRATEYDLYEKIQPMIEKLARKHFPDLNESMSQQERASDSRRAELESQLMKRYPNKAQRDQIIDQLLTKGK